MPVRVTGYEPRGRGAPYTGSSWIIAAQFSGDTGHLWFEPSSTPGFRVQVWYADGTTDAVNVTNASGAAAFASQDLGATGED